MESRHYRLTLLLVLLATIVVGIVLVNNGSQKNPLPAFAVSDSTEALIDRSTSNIQSPDGKASLTVSRKNVNDIKSAAIYFSQEGEVKHEIYSKTFANGGDLEIPFNTFSPDNKYIFLKIIENGNITYPVILTNSKLNIENNRVGEISSLFYDKYPDLIITDVTGWGGIGLIIVNTDKTEGGKGPSFWYSVQTNSFIQLSTRFD